MTLKNQSTMQMHSTSFLRALKHKMYNMRDNHGNFDSQQDTDQIL